MSEIPAEVAHLFRADGPVEVIEHDALRVTLRCADLVLAFRRSTDNGWDFDEVIGHALVHIEQMSNESYWIGLTTDEGSVNVDIGSSSGRAAVRMTGWSE